MLQIDVISDVVCPWCFIGEKRLLAAVQEGRYDVELRFHPYDINPGMPKEGRERLTHYKKKFGSLDKLHAMTKALLREGEALGINYDFDAIKRVPNTMDAHRLIRWARSAGVQGDVVSALFSAYFEQGRDISHPEVLMNIAENAGMDVGIVSELLSTDRDQDQVRADIARAQHMGVSGVPTFIFANKFAVAGAQEKAMFVTAMDQAASLT